MGYPLVWVEWEDSAQGPSGWSYLDELLPPDIVRCVSVGFLIDETKSVKVVAAHVGQAGKPSAQACGIIRIPKRSILKFRRLKRP